ncbi:MAG: UDP-N-acetylglucosamine 2-epimerase (non-hydrolyzing) [Balneolaceae bacterium]|nr:UDP-N-acetylglucosamine 2-epimerase (non-hydrolyzing) [Balneolaceae bacterium]
MEIITVVGARPQFIKAAVVSKALHSIGINEDIVHTGQHYDHSMSTIFWEELDIPVPSTNLNIGSGSHGAQTGEMMIQLESFILNRKSTPNAILVYGDTNSTLAGALVASKLHIPIIHIEAGLRSFNRKMPEEINRLLTDQISDILFCSSEIGVHQLEKEQIEGSIYNVGDVMYDAFLTFSEISKKKKTDTELLFSDYLLATIHRPSNTDSDNNLNQILEAFNTINQTIVWPVHPRNKQKLSNRNLPNNLVLLEPQSYFDMNALLRNCEKVITDSGGLQKEAYWAKKPCITVRDETEWVETLHGGWNQLTGPDTNKIMKAFNAAPNTHWKPLYGDGNAANAIATKLKDFFENIL